MRRVQNLRLDPRALMMGLAIIAGYFLLLSYFIGEEVAGGVEGGTPVDTYVEGNTVVTEVEGGREVTYAADTSREADVRWLAIVAAVLAVIVLLVVIVRRLRVDWSQLPGELFGGFIVGIFVAFITGMPIAKAVPADVQWWVIGPLFAVGMAVVFGIAALNA